MMKFKTRLISGLTLSFLIISCSKDDGEKLTQGNLVDTGTHSLFTTVNGSGKHTLVFESGLGDNYESWYKLASLSKNNQTIVYNRAGYSPSEFANTDRDLIALSSDLNQIIENKSQNDKVILIGHSLGGAIIRYYASMYPEKIEGLIFVDPSHEDYGEMTQIQEDKMFEFFTKEKKPEIANEALQMIENFLLLKQLPNLPDIPTIVLTSIKDRTGVDKTNWVNAHESIGNNSSDFTHIKTNNSSHYIQIEEPKLVIDAINTIISKL